MDSRHFVNAYTPIADTPPTINLQNLLIYFDVVFQIVVIANGAEKRIFLFAVIPGK